MAREILIAGDRLLVEVLAEIRAIARSGESPSLGRAIEAARLAVAQEQPDSDAIVPGAGETRIDRALVTLAATAIATIVRIRSSR